MGTRSITKFFSEDSEKCIVTIYQLYDGRPSGVGAELANFLKGKKVVNGFDGDQSIETGFANGMGCLAAQFVASHKTKIGGFYLFPEDCERQSYNYTVRLVDNKIQIEINGFFKGSAEELLEYIKKEAVS